MAETTNTTSASAHTGGQLKRVFELPSCGACKRRSLTGLIGAIATVVISAPLGLGLGVALFPVGNLRALSMFAAVVVGYVFFFVTRKLTHPRGHSPGCHPIKRTETDPALGNAQDPRIYFANGRFAELWRELNPDSIPEAEG